MSDLPRSHRRFHLFAAILLPAAAIAALLWFYDLYSISWRHRLFPFAALAVTLAVAALTLLMRWLHRERKATALLWKSALSTLVFSGGILFGTTMIQNRDNAHPDWASSWFMPLAAAQIVVLFVLLLLGLRKHAGSKTAVLSGITAVLLAAAVPGVALLWQVFYRVPQEKVSPIFPEAQLKQESIPYDEGEFIMKDGDILASSFAEALDKLNERSADAPVTVWLKGGTYAGPDFTLPDFTSPKNVTLRNVPGEEVIFTGAAEVTGWTEDTVNGVACWSAPWPYTKITFTSLYHPDPDKQLCRPRYPAEGYLFVDHVEGAKAMFTEEDTPWEYTRGNTSFFAKEGDLRQFRNLESVTLRILHYWKDELANVVSYDEATRELVWDRPAAMRVEPEHRYFLENVFEELKQPGQWYLDGKNEKVYYIPFAGEDMENTVLYAGAGERLLRIDGAENVTFRGITFKNTAWGQPDGGTWGVDELEFPQAAYGVRPSVLVTNSTGVAFERCRFENIGSTALKLGEGVHDSSIENCEFKYIGGNAVYIQGSVNAPNTKIDVKNNLIEHYGRRFFCAIGILNIHANHVEITNNEIHDGYYTGISSGWIWGYGENPTDYVTIENNLIYNIGQGWLSDMGGIYCLGIQENSVIRGNVIHNVAADPLQGGYGGWGIYLDEGSTGQLVEKNLVYDCGSQSFHQHYGKENLVRNNVFAFGGEGQIRVSRKEEHTSIILKGNIIVSDKQPIYASLEKEKFIDDANLYYDYANPGRLFSGDDYKTGIRKMQQLGYYKNALVADPLFRDVDARDFTLALNSPALEKIGFEAWNYSAAGRTEG